MTRGLPRGVEQRRRRYVDSAVQRRLLVGLVGLEIALVAVAMAILYWQLSAVIDQNLYRIHQQPRPIIAVLLPHLAAVAAGFVLVNAAVVLLAQRRWARYVNRVVAALRERVVRTRDLDLGADPVEEGLHETLTLMARWRRIERARHQAVRHALEQLTTPPDLADPDQRTRTRAALTAVVHALEPAGRG